MEVPLKHCRINITRGVGMIAVKRHFTTEHVCLDDFDVSMAIYDASGQKIHNYTGSVFTKCKDIAAQICNEPFRMFISSNRGVEAIGDNCMPIIKCLYKTGESVRISASHRVVIVKHAYRVGFRLLDAISVLGSLRRLKLANCGIRKIPDVSMLRLTHINLSNNKIHGSVYANGTFSKVDLSHNRICSVLRMNASSLNLAHNAIRSFSQTFKYQYLSLSHNPLEEYSSEACVVDLSFTRVQFVCSRVARKVILDGTQDVRLGMFDRLIYLSICNCQLRTLDVEAKSLKVLKARSNLIECVPVFPALEYLDISRNLVREIQCKQLTFLNASMNQLITFDFRQMHKMVHLDLSYNPIMSLEGHVQPSTTYLRLEHIHMDIVGEAYRPMCMNDVNGCTVHVCKKTDMVVEQIVISNSVQHLNVFIVCSRKPGDDIKSAVNATFSRIDGCADTIEWFERFRSMLNTLISEMDTEASYLICMVTSEHVVISRIGMDAVFSNFAHIRILNEPECVYIYDNIGSWNLIPVICPLKDTVSRFDVLDTLENDIGKIMRFMNYECPLAMAMSISDFCIFDECKPASGVRCTRSISAALKGCLEYERELNTVVEKRSVADRKRRLMESAINGCGNYNPVLKTSSRLGYDSLITNPNPVFVFCRIFPRNSADIHACIVSNTRNIIRMACNIFFGVVVESSIDFYVLAFHDRIEACLWGLKIQEMLGCVYLDVSVGMACGVFYTKISGDHVRFYGPALNKAARLVNLGCGVFCCDCVRVEHPKIVYVQQGKKSLKGFDGMHMIYVLKQSRVEYDASGQLIANE
ncbi:hypothetical protein HK407_02g02740 [Ordospora pajunii]|uniref:uncharacterized protein n=1 Tax=Ordospora pajunii TaxID=3039483 RepID=UPI0029526E96|nr:uncharacterized protein HK407_02g02740 [Ordospora pajunii]KAH9412052.1 hypothetical protein HK407_02g02740 [Ordospora pajunii]